MGLDDTLKLVVQPPTSTKVEGLSSPLKKSNDITIRYFLQREKNAGGWNTLTAVCSKNQCIFRPETMR